MNVIYKNDCMVECELDLYNDDDCLELGKILSKECVVFVNSFCTEKRLYDIHMLWGQSTAPLTYQLLSSGKFKGRKWREIALNLGYVVNEVDKEMRDGMTRVSYQVNEKGRPTGIFANGELNWHCNEQARWDAQRVVGLMSLHDSENSQTSFMRTDKVYDALNHEDKSMVDDLITVWKWDGGIAVGDLIESQKQLIHIGTVPIDGMETPLLDETSYGTKGMHFPSHCFSHFRTRSGEIISDNESNKIKNMLWEKLDKKENTYFHDWKDGQVMFMDQNITLHARPTNITYGNRRTMSRMASYMNRLFPESQPKTDIMYKNKIISIEQFAELVNNEYQSVLS